LCIKVKCVVVVVMTDVDECGEGTDRCGTSEDVMCFNTRGSYRCPRVDCPSGFSRSALGPRRNR